MISRLEALQRRLDSWRWEQAHKGPMAKAAPRIIAQLEMEITALRDAREDGPMARIAKSLSPPMVMALKRLCRSMVYADQRSVAALCRRGLVECRGRIENEPLLGSFSIDIPTALGREVNSYLIERGTA